MVGQRKLVSGRTSVTLGLVAAASIAVAALTLTFRPDGAPLQGQSVDAGESDRYLLDHGSIPLRAVDGLRGTTEEQNRGPEARVLLLGGSVHACRFGPDLREMTCRQIDHVTQYGPHGEPDVGFAESEPGAPDWVTVPRRGGATAWSDPDVSFELVPETRVLSHVFWVNAFIGRDQGLSVIQNHLEEDVLVHGRTGDAMDRVKLPGARGATELVGSWLLWPGEDDQTWVAHASPEGLARHQRLSGRSAGAACHTREGVRILGMRDGKAALFVEAQGSWSTIADVALGPGPTPSVERSPFEQRVTTLTCMNTAAVIVAQTVRRLDPTPNTGVDDCAGPDACRFLLELDVARCDSRRCTSDPRRTIALGAGGLAGRPRVLPLADALLVLWMTHAGTLRMQRVRAADVGRPRDVLKAPLSGLASAWSNESVAAALLTEQGRGVRAIRLGPADDEVSVVEQR